MVGVGAPEEEDQVAVSEQDRIAFLRRRGWREDMSDQERQELESQFPDEVIEEARALGF